ncbi:SAM-dependent methyltransferase [Acidiluteibacter ferrifornacis]|uniref:SAM-dependent methyltransferase n=1 Tax=Acidiluteibacter ferrifornacis TaxID=2692424 RepID=A0A6N9NKK8_9FLAO|nr:SAM-dependent methyltransferase [Acidiluteibacter ferrifornacis]NBG67238.1 SAM-dependent methyltransferase [Acidiluteibacter ferrifornacis]
MNNQKGDLYLIPNLLGGGNPDQYLGKELFSIIQKLTHFIVENEKNARRYLIKLGIPTPIDDLNFFILNKHTDLNDLHSYIKPLKDGISMGLISDAGCPGVADPGAEIVKIAHQFNIPVRPLIGPSSILLGLMASGFNGQSFCFHGYLPHDSAQRIKQLKSMELTAKKEKQTQLFIETPFRNEKLIEELVRTLDKQTMLCVAADLSLESVTIVSQNIGSWKKGRPNFHKRPAIFLIF